MTLYGVGAVVGPIVAASLMNGIGIDGYYWSLIGLHGVIAAFFVYRMRVWRSPLAKVAPHEASLPARAFFLPATFVMARRGKRTHR